MPPRISSDVGGQHPTHLPRKALEISNFGGVARSTDMYTTGGLERFRSDHTNKFNQQWSQRQNQEQNQHRTRADEKSHADDPAAPGSLSLADVDTKFFVLDQHLLAGPLSSRTPEETMSTKSCSDYLFEDDKTSPTMSNSSLVDGEADWMSDLDLADLQSPAWWRPAAPDRNCDGRRDGRRDGRHDGRYDEGCGRGRGSGDRSSDRRYDGPRSENLSYDHDYRQGFLLDGQLQLLEQSTQQHVQRDGHGRMHVAPDGPSL